jgi:hypothetical protein
VLRQGSPYPLLELVDEANPCFLSPLLALPLHLCSPSRAAPRRGRHQCRRAMPLERCPCTAVVAPRGRRPRVAEPSSGTVTVRPGHVSRSSSIGRVRSPPTSLRFQDLRLTARTCPTPPAPLVTSRPAVEGCSGELPDSSTPENRLTPQPWCPSRRLRRVLSLHLNRLVKFARVSRLSGRTQTKKS